MTEPKDDASISDLIKAIEDAVAMASKDQALPPGTVIDEMGNLVKLEEEDANTGIIYGSPIELPDNLFPSKK